jgi:antirestriction protein ArdC
MAPSIRCDLYTEVTSRILAELERGAAPGPQHPRRVRTSLDPGAH